MDINKKGYAEGKTRKELIESLYRLSGLQQGMLFHGLYNEGKGAYLEQMTCDFLKLDIKIFNKSWEHIFKKHSVLRTAFIHNETSVPVQCVYKEANLPVEIIDLRKMNESEQEEAIKQYEEADRNKGFDFNTAPLMRIGLIRLKENKYHMLWTWHHILFDGWSMPVLMHEFLSTYELLISGKEITVGEVDRFEGYIKYIERRDKDKQEKYWRKYLKGLDHSTLLPFIGTTSHRTKGEGTYVKTTLTFDKKTTERIGAFVQKNRLTLNTLFQGAWAYLLHNYTAKNEIVFGVIVSGRPDDLPGIEQRVGLYINTLPLYSVLKKDQSTVKWLQDIQFNQLSSGQYQYAPLQDIQRWTGITGDLFDSILVFENYPVSEIAKSKKWSLGVENIEVNDQTNYPLTILVGGSEELSVIFHYNKEILKDEYIQEISNHFENVINQIISSEDSKLGEIKLLSESEENLILEKFNDTIVINPEDKTIAQLFEMQAEKTPDNIALVFGKQELTYKELNERANKLALFLKSKGVKEETLVPVCIERSLEMIIGVIAILKAGGAYVPVDPDFPMDRIEYMLENSGAALMLSSKETKSKLQIKNEIDIIEIDGDQPAISKQPFENLNVKFAKDNLAYMLYTSGSTGNPKGVKMPGSSLVNLLLWQDKQFVNKQRKVLQFTSLNFDVSFQEIFSTLCFGSSLYLISADRRIDMSDVLKDIAKYKITHLFVPFIVLKNLAEHIASQSGDSYSLEEIITAGEQLKLTNDLVLLLKKSGISLVNQYGPTEAHVVSSYTIDIKNDISPLPPIGKPIDNVRLYILGENFQPVPVGVSGELFIGGEQLAKGYLNLPELTEEKFIKDPFSKVSEARMYKTGDICRWLPDGNIDYLGRADDQIKIRGYRVELGEIESVLQECELVRQAVVLSLDTKEGNKRLAGYIVANEKFDKEKIASYLRSKLPDYMVPSLWVEMESLPLTQNGKIDKRALPDPDITELINNEYVAPRNETEEKLVLIWQELLGIKKIGINDNFFEMGGHSLLVMRVISSIRRELDLELSVKDVFVYPTVAELAVYINSLNKGTSLPAITVESRPELIPLSFSQERLWFIDKLEGSVQYHLPAVLRLTGKLNKDALVNALQNIVNRHEVLRTVIKETEGKGYQFVNDKDCWKLQITDGSVYKDDNEGLLKLTQQLINTPFDLSRDHMMRGDLINLNEDENILVVTLHHIASDGWSVSILVKEFIEFYKAYEEKREAKLDELQIQFVDFAVWQRKYIQGEVLDNKLDYWKKKLEGLEPLELPADYARPAVQSSKGAVATFKIEKELTGQLLSLSQKNGATLFMTLLSAYNILLHRYSGQSDICVGSPNAGRIQKETEDLIGFFINTLALRSQVNSSESFKELLEQIKTTTLEAYENQEAPFEKIVDALVIQRDMSRTPLFGVTFALQNMPDVPELRLKELTLSNEEYGHNIAKFDITLSITQTPDGLEGSVEYCTDLYKEETINRMMSNYKELLKSIAADPDQKIGSLPLITKSEEYKLLTEFNDTYTDYPKDKTLVDMFELQAKKSPDSEAVVFENERLTYSELNERSNRLAHYLQKKGVEKETLVPICLERSPEMIIGILGIMKAGGAYVPVDPEYPEDRIRYMLEDTKAKLVLSTKESKQKLSTIENIDFIELDGDWEKIKKSSKANLKRIAKPENLAYVIYTSGSTGQPKGAMNEHRGIVNRLNWAQEYYKLTPEDSVLQKTTFCFDVSVWELIWPLLVGSRLVFAKPEGQKDTWYLKSVIDNEKITMVHFVPSMLGLFLSEIQEGECPGLKKVLCSGEALKQSHVESFIKKLPKAELHNLYGPTEAAIDVTYWSLSEKDKAEEIKIVPIGKPVANTSMYILDEQNGLVPLGGIGQLHIGGVQVARGYLNRPELTAEKFVKDPFSKEADARMYKTGDLGKWLPDGNIEYLGRMDDQVKVRGLRIELGEIEAGLTSIDGVLDAKVVLAENKKSDDQKLNAYLRIDKDKLPLLNNYQYLLDKKQIVKSDLHILPDGLPILAANQNEVKFLYNEIFEDNYYLKHGITLNKNSCVIDIGANVGFFTVFLNVLSEDIKVYSFEPIPEVYNYLNANRHLYNVKGNSYQLAVLDKEKDIEFVYYPQMSILSSITEDKGNVKDVVRSYIESSEKTELLPSEMESLLETKLESRKITCKAKTVSQIISEEKLEKIDLLKIDVENSEHLVLAGLLEKDWDKIESVIIEIHDVDGRLKDIQDMLEHKGFKIYVEKEKMLSKDAVLYNLYATRSDNRKGLENLGNNEKLRKAGWQAPLEFVKSIKEILEKKLPSYMVPTQIIFLDEFPLTSNGKLDRKALPDPESIELFNKDYVPPRNKTEEDLVAIWKELLHAKQIGVYDNFFELGGDSMITIQILSRARRSGYELTPKDFFIYQTIAGLSGVIAERSEAAVTGEQGLLTGRSGLLPIQQWYFESADTDISHFNQSLLLGLNKSVSEDELEKAVELLMTQHDALRFKYHNEDGKWIQEYGTDIGKLHVVDLHSAKKNTLSEIIKEHADNYNRSLDIEKGEIVKFVFIKTPDSETENRILIVIHHLAVDGASWRILLDDLEMILSALQKGEKPDPGMKSSSFRQWYDELEKYSKSSRLLSQSKYWEKAEKSFEPLFSDKEYKDVIKAKDIDVHSVRLDNIFTQKLLQEVPKIYHTEINDILLCALAITLCEKGSTEKIVIGMEGHGRESISEDIDTSRTIGWFTSLYPLLLETVQGGNISDSIKAIKEQLRRVPDKGLGYGVLKYINRDEKLSAKQSWDIVFNYLGQLDKVVGSSKWFAGAGESSGEFRSEEMNATEKLSVNSMIQGGELILNWSYSNRHYNKETIIELTGKYKSVLESLITHCLEEQKSGLVFTPSDYGLGSEINYKELDKFLDEPFRGKTRKDFTEGIYRLSGLQQGMLFHGLYDETAGAYTEQLSCDLTNPDPEIIVKSWNSVLRKHTILRSGFYNDEFKIPVQCVYNEAELPVTILDYRNLSNAEQIVALSEFKESDHLRGFDFKTAPLMRIALIRLSDERYEMLWTSHHLIFDGWSLPILMGEFLSNYEMLISGNEVIISEEDRYEDYIRYIERTDIEQQETYWRNYMKGVESSTLLPFIGATSQRTKGVGVYENDYLKFNKEITSQVNRFAQKHRITINTIMQGIWAYLLHKYTGSNDIVYGVIVSGRPDDLPGIEQRVGMYINTLPLHSVLNKNQNTEDWLKELQKHQVSSRQYQYTPLQEIQSRTGVSGDLFDSLLVFENYPVSEVIGSREWKLKVKNVKVEEQTNYPLTITIGSAEEINIVFSYNSSILKREYILEMQSHFENILLQIISNDDVLINDLDLVTKQEKQKLLSEINAVETTYPKDKTIIDLFEEQAEKTPDKIAVVYKDQSLTYKELNERSNSLANYLQSKGVKTETLVPICIERSIDMIVGILGILKAGGVYVPVDPDYPEERINYIIEDTSAALIVSSKESRFKIKETGNLNIIEIDKDWSKISKNSSANQKKFVKPHNLAYIIYTSGSTGKPKGVLIEHYNVVRLLKTDSPLFDFTEKDVWTMFHSFCFDFSVWEMYGALFFGGKIVIVSKDATKDSSLFSELLFKEKVTVLNQIPSSFYVLQDSISEKEISLSVRYVIFGGEALDPAKLKIWKELYPDCKLINMYGITETTVHVTYQEIEWQQIESGKSLIGKPIPTLSLLILDTEQKLLPAGIAGEICVGGAGLARGYLNRPELTAEKFIKNPFSEDPESRLYRSGDLGIRLPDGNIEYAGRIDEQVKIRGYRIELGEIESALNECVSVRQAIVIAKSDKQSNKFLIAYIISEDTFNREEIISYLKEKLPEYMIPALWVEMESFPLASSGKINKKALPDPDASELLKNEFVAPRNELENKITEIWKELLNTERVGIHDNFFELGGHSLLAMRAISAIRKELELEIDIKDIFLRPTIAELSMLLEVQEKGSLLPAIKTQERPEYIPLSFSQERLWFIDRMEGSIQYHMPTVLRLNGQLNKDGLVNALQQTINRHEVLRTVIREKDGVGYQFIKEEDSWELEKIDGSVYKEDVKGLQNYIQDLVKIPFDLSKDHMIKGYLIKISEDEHILVINMHHIASDGWSVSLIVKEITELYSANIENRAANLLPLTIQYVDYALWQRKYLQGEVFDKKLSYWKQKLQDVERLLLPADFTRPVILSSEGANVRFSIDKKLSEQLSLLSQKHGATLFMTLLSVYKILLYRYTGQQDICVGIGIAGRQQQEMESLIGFFVNTLAMRSEVNGHSTFTELLQQEKAITMEAFENQEVPFEKVVDAVVGERDIIKNTLVQVSFVLQNTPEITQVNSGKLILSNAEFEHTTAKFDLSLSMRETPEGLEGIMEYSTDLFREQTIELMIAHFKELVNSVVENPDERIGALTILSQTEKHQLLYDFNDTYQAYPKNSSVVDLFEEQTTRTPDAIALIFEGKQISYRELNEKSNKLAHYLISKGVKKETLVPVCIERSFEMITGILAVLKAGGAYVPIDPDYPADRISFMLEDTGAKIVIGSKYSIPKLPETDEIEIIEAGSSRSENIELKSNNPSVGIEPHNLAYVIYTSGSTGKPKGVLIEHSSVVNLISWHNKEYEVSDKSKTTTMAGVGFDAFGWEVWPYLSAGAAIYIIDDEMRVYTSELLDFFNANKLTHSFMATALIQDFINESRFKVNSLKFLLTGGDKLSSVSLEGIDYKFINNYGPTENTVVTTNHVVTDKDNYIIPPIGKPISNTNVQIISRDGQLVPVGVAGEINIGGASLARGYLNRQELTDEKFITTHFYSGQEKRMYRTGDLGRWLSDGNIEFSGRLDDQVKIRGYRIELGEIESVMNNLDSVNSSCVLVKPNTDNKLVAYYVPDQKEVKIKERELYQRQIAGWKELYDTEYSKTEEVEDVDVEFNIIGWNDSFTGGIIAPWQMKEWVDDIVEEILSKNPENVLEIGSGTGLIYYRLAEEVKKYIGTDFSRSAIEQINHRVKKGLRNYCPTELQICAAHEIKLNEDEKIDTIILNSIVQYFPGADYMSEVIGNSISLLKGKGRIIVGDVRDNRLLELFKGRLHIDKLNHSVPVKEFKWTMQQDVLKEEELCFTPEYFYNLQSLYPEITNIEIKWKQASYINELSLYRYTVVISVGLEKETIDPEWKNWDELKDKQSVIKQLEKNSEIIALSNVPNPRLFKERLLTKALNDKAVSNVGDLLSAMELTDEESATVNESLNFAKSKHYQFRFFLDEDPLKVNLLIEKNTSDSFVKLPLKQKQTTDKVSYTNTPLFNDIGLMLKKEIRALLQQSLPEYMVPSELIALNQLPLTNNGKIDRKFLSLREDLVISNKLDYKAPDTDTEKMLVNIWEELLGVERVGIHDNFFELGGHSLLGMRVISSIRKNLQTELAIKDLFLFPTIAELAVHLESQSKGILLPSVEVLQRPEFIPLSFSQERLWFIDQLEGTLQYHMPSVLRFKGKLKTDSLEFSLQSIINRHEVLRTVILENEGIGYQSVKDKDNWKLQIIDGSAFRDNAESLQNYIKELINTPFNLSEDYMLRAHLINVNEDDHILVLTMHHIASDGWSVSVIVKELVELYESNIKNRESGLQPLQVQYADFAMWQRKYIQGEVLDKKLSYWKDKLEGTEPLQLPVDFPRPAVQSIKGSNIEFNIDKELSDTLLQLSQKNGATLFMTLLAAFNVLLHRYSSQQDICVGSPIAGRQQEEVEDLIGFFINTLALRSEVISKESFTGLLKKVRTTTLEAYENQEIPFEKVLESVSKQRDLNRSPLFQVMFVLQNIPDVPELSLGDLQLSEEAYKNSSARFDLTLFMVESPDGLRGSMEYCTDLYKEETIVRMIDHYKELLKSIVNDPLQKIGSLRMLSEAEEHKLLFYFNNTATDYPKNKSIIELFEEQAANTPEAVAVSFEKEKLTYKELSERSNQLAHYLQSKGIKSESLIPVCIERSIGLMVGILGVLKAGCAYVPIDPEYPEERIRFMLKDTGSSVIISSRESIEKLPALEDYSKIEIDKDWKIISEQPSDILPLKTKPDDTAYVIYTSGSTGWPKGVMVTQRNVVSLVKNVDYVKFVNEDVLLSTGSTSFDATTFEYWGMLLNGGQLVLCTEDRLLDSGLLKEEIETRGVTKMWFTSSWFNQLVDNDITLFSKLKTILAGGEKLSEYHIEKVRQTYPEIEIINGYGPTENTTFSLTYNIKETEIKGSIPIGIPLNNRKAYVLNNEQQLSPVGVAGEVYLGGDGLSKGYLNRPELTAEKFVKDPFSKETDARLYKTGDLGRWLADGNIEYLGRMDDQIKIRGYRIELGEIENALQECESVRQAVVIAKETKEGSKRLVGYVVPEGKFDKEAILTFLKNRLPEHMVPALWVEMESLPLTSNGKVDKRALPDPDASDLISNEYVAPRNELEVTLAEIWKELLQVERVGINDNFFELGGDSIITIQVVSRARRHGYELKPKEIFLHQTIGSLSAVIAERAASVVTGEQGLLTGECGLVPIQQWFFEVTDSDISHFNQSILLSIEKSVTPEVLNKAINHITDFHDALRFRYYKKDGKWIQEYCESVETFVTVDLQSADKDSLGNLIKEHADKFNQSLDIEKGDIAKFVLIQTPGFEKHNRILMVIHHLAVDGVSWRILLEDLELLLNGIQKEGKASLGNKASSFRQWYEVLDQYSQSKRLLSQISYWEKAVSCCEPLKTDKEYAGTVKAGDISSHTIILDTVKTQLLIHEVPRVYHTEINDILLCALALTICEWSSKDKVIIGMEGHGRENISESIDTSRTAGWFTSLYPVLLELGPDRDLSVAIKSVKEQLRRVPDKGLGYGVLKYINKDEKVKSASGKDDWDIVFNYLGQLDKVVSGSKWLSGAEESPGEFRSMEQSVSEKLSFSGMIRGGELILSLTYSGLHFKTETISDLLNKYKSTLESLIDHCMDQQKSGSVHTPSDYGLGSEISFEELDQFLKVDDNEDIMSF